MYTYRAKIIENLPEGILINGTIVLKSEEEWYGHSYGTCVGIIFDDGEKKSFIAADGEGTGNFDKLLEAGILKERHKYIVNTETGKERGIVYYYVMRKIVGHSSGLPTITEDCLDTCCNVQYHYTYEILLVGDEGDKRYVTVDVDTDGPHTFCLTDAIEDLEYTFEGWAEDKKYGFSKDDYGTLHCQFFDDFGHPIDAEFNSTRELMMCVNSIRIVKLQK